LGRHSRQVDHARFSVARTAFLHVMRPQAGEHATERTRNILKRNVFKTHRDRENLIHT
jgi:hypothetical protein